MVHEDRHFVDSMLGLEGMRVDVGERRPFAPRDSLVLGSDGLFDNLGEKEIVEVVRKGALAAAAAVLLSLVRERMASTDPLVPGKADDLAFILYRPTGTRGRRP